MKWFVLVVFLAISGISAQDVDPPEPCDEKKCLPPDCRCASTKIPGSLAPRDTPQFVMVTFDDGVNIDNIRYYREALYDRVNSNGCPAGATFYVSHEYTDYQLVNELYNNSFEIALHSISHMINQTYWVVADEEVMAREFGDQRLQMAHFANIPIETIRGVRMPFLQMTGNAMFNIMREYGILYDASWPTSLYLNPGLWPYTLDYATFQDCAVPPCPNASIPGAWVLPMLSWLDLRDIQCSMADSCFWVPGNNDENGWLELIIKNFERQYLGNRAPFGVYIHEAYLKSRPGLRAALKRFMDLVNRLPDVFMVNAGDVIDWVRSPVSLDEYKDEPCKSHVKTICPVNTCGPLASDHNVWNPEAQYYMTACNVCPRVYPWVKNPLGV